MIKYCFAYFNKLGGFYGQPFFADHKQEFSKMLYQSLFAASKDTLESLKEDELYYIGSFDNESGLFVGEKEFVCDLSPMVSEIMLKKFGDKEDGKEKN